MKLVIGILMAVVFSYIFLPTHAGGYPLIHPTVYPVMSNGMIFIPINKNKAIHLHHWLIALLLCTYFYNKNQYIFGFLIGICIQGLTYSDWNTFIAPNPYIK